MNAIRLARPRIGLALLLFAFGCVVAGSPAWAADSGPLQFFTVKLCRVFDSRFDSSHVPPDHPLRQGTTYTVTVAGVCGVPADAVRVHINVAVIGAADSGNLSVFPAGAAPPNGNPPIGAISFSPINGGATDRGMEFDVDLGTGGAISFVLAFSVPGTAAYHAKIDVSGYYKSGAAVANNDNSGNLNNLPVLEDSGATTLDVLANDTDPLSNPFSVIAVQNPSANGGTVINNGTNVSYQPAANYCNNPPPYDTFTYTITGGSTATVSVGVTCVNDAPAGTDKAVSTAENTDYVFSAADFGFTDLVDSPANAFLAVRITTLPTAGTLKLSNVAVTAGQSIPVAGIPNLTFTPATNGNGSPYTAFGFRVQDDGGTANGGIDLDATQRTITVNVTGINNEPTLDPILDPADINEDAGLQTVNLAGIGAGGGGTESTQTLTVTAVSNNPGLIPNPTVTYTSPNATGSLSYTPVANQSGSAIITVTVQDDGGTANGGDDTIQHTFTVDVLPVNDEPTLDPIADPADIGEDAGLQTVSLTGIGAGGGGTESTQTLAMTAVSNNPGLIPNPTVVYTSPNATGSLSYTPVAGQSGSAIITVTVQDDGGTASGGDDTIQRTFTVDVTAVNDEPTLDPIPDPADINEDAGLQTVSLTGIGAGGGGTESTQVLTVTAVSNNPGLIPNPTVTYTSPNATGSLSYTSVANQSGSAIITVTVQDDGGTANGGDDTIQRTFTVDVVAVNDEPTLDPIPDPTDINEDAGLQTVNLTGIGAGGGGTESTQTLTVTAVSNNPALIPNPLVTYTSPNGTGSLSYTPVANQFGSAIITVTVQDNGGTANGGDDTIQRTFTVDVLSVDDEPTLDPIADPADINEDAGLQTVSLTGIGAGGAGTESTQTLTVTAVSNNPGLIPNPTVTYTSPNATGSLSYTPVANQFGSAIITVTVQDNGGTANGGDDTIQRTFTVDVLAVNDEPTLNPIADPADINEDAGLQTVSLTGIGAGGAGTESTQTLTVTAVSSNPGLIPNPTVTYTSPNATGSLSYTSVANQSGSAIITVTVQDNGGTANGGDDTIQRTFTVDVLAANDEPTLNPIPDPADINEDAGLQTVSLTGIGAGGAGTESAQTLTVTAVSNNPGLIPNPTVTYTSPNATGSLSYTSVSNQSGSAIITVTVQDNGGTANGGDDTIQRTFTVDVLAVNEEPTLNLIPDPADINEDAGLQTVNLSGISAGGGESQTLTVTAVSSNPAVIPNPTVSYTSPNAIGSLSYTPVANAFGNGITITVTVQDNGGTANGGDNTVQRTFTFDVLPVNDPPQFVDSTLDYTTVGNTQLRGGDLTTGASVAYVRDNLDLSEKSTPSDIDGPAPPFTYSLAVAPVNGQATVSSDGTFTYEPNPGFTGPTDTFTVAVSDGGPPPNTSNLTVTVTISQMVWYIHDVVAPTNPNNPLNGDDGRSTNPFDSIAEFNTATTNNGDIIYIFEGNTATTPHSGTITLKDGQKLWGQGIDLNVPGFGTPLVTATNKPRIRTTAASTDVVSVPATGGNRNNVQIRGLDLEATGATSNAIDVTATGANTVGVTISNDNVRGVTAEGIDLNSGGTAAFGVTIQNNTVTATGNGIDTRVTSTGIATVTASTNTISSSANAFDARTQAGASALRVALDTLNVTAGGTGIVIDGSAAGTTTITAFSNNIVSGNTAGAGIAVTSATFDQVPGGAINQVSGGATVVGASGNGVGGSGFVMTNVTGDLLFADLDIFADAGAGLRASGTGGFTLGVGNVSTVTAVGGPAVDLSGTAMTLPFQFISSSNSPTTGVALNSVTGTFSAGSGSSITSATGTSFQVGSSNATVTYNGTINTTTGKGIDLTSNTGSTIGFTGTLTLSTGANAAFNATGGGTVTATDIASTLTSTTGTALKVSGGTIIGASGLMFDRISTNGAANGIFLDSTGAGTLTVDGGSSTAVGGDGSGGVIQNTSGSTPSGVGVYLNNARAILRRMHIHDHPNYGLFGSGATTLTLEYSTVDSTATATSTNGDSATADDEEGSVAFEEWAGSGTITSCIIGDGFSNNLRVLNTNGADLDRLTVTNSTFNNNGLAGNNNIHLESRNSGTTLNFTLQGSTIKGARADWINASNNSLSTMDLVISGNAFSNLSPNAHAAAAAGGNRIVLGSVGTLTYDILNNTLEGSKGEAIRVRSTAASGVAGTANGTISGNDIGHSGIANSGSSESSGIFLFTDGGGDQTALVTGNEVYQYNNHGIRVDVGDEQVGTSVVNVTVTSNIVGFPGNLLSDFNGIHLNHGTVAATDDFTSCIDIRLNTVTGSGNGVTYPNNAEIRLRQRQNTTVVLPGYSGLNNEDCNVIAFIAGQNTVNNSGAGSCTNGTPNPPTKNTAATTQNATTTVRGFESGAACIQPN